MELSTPSTQRSSSETLTIQPGSVRSPLADAASDFARHLAENAKQKNDRRDDRPVERRERSTASERTEARREEASPREAARRERDEKEVKSAATGAEDVALTEEPAAPEAEVAGEDISTEEEAAKPEQTAEAANDDGNGAGEKNSDKSDTEDGTDPPVAAAVTVTETTPAKAVNEIDAKGATAAKPAGDAQQQPAAPANADAEKKAAAAAPESAEVNSLAGNEEAQPKKTGQARSATQLPTQAQAAAPSSGEVPAGVEEQQAAPLKTEKGLGQEAADKLAEKKSGDKQTGTQPNVAAAPASQAARAVASPATAPQQVAPSSSTASSSPSGDLAISSVSQVANGGNAATIRIGTLPGQSQPTQIPANTIALQMARNLQKGTNRFDIRLDPPEMGRIDVRMEVRKDGHVVAHMSVDRPETLDLLQRDARALQQALTNAGLQTDSDSLNFSLRDQNTDGGTRDFSGGGSRGIAGDDADIEGPVAPIYNVNLAANGGVDIRI